MRDISNNLKLYRAEILKALRIEEPGFAANVETGLKPLLDGYRIDEVPISWINRTPDMGSSSFRIASVAPGYFRARWSARCGILARPHPPANASARPASPLSPVPADDACGPNTGR